MNLPVASLRRALDFTYSSCHSSPVQDRNFAIGCTRRHLVRSLQRDMWVGQAVLPGSTPVRGSTDTKHIFNRHQHCCGRTAGRCRFPAPEASGEPVGCRHLPASLRSPMGAAWPADRQSRARYHPVAATAGEVQKAAYLFVQFCTSSCDPCGLNIWNWWQARLDCRSLTIWAHTQKEMLTSSRSNGAYNILHSVLRTHRG